MVSIVVPVYNVEKHIDKCVESLLHQTFSDIEIILVDDGSGDSSGKKCDDYAEKDSRVLVIHQENHGVSAARNRGIEKAQGEWLLFVDGDDYAEPRFVECLYNEIVSSGADISMCNYFSRDEEGNKISRSSHSFVSAMSALDNVDTLLLFENKQYGTFFDVLWNKIYKKNLFDGIRFPEGVSLVEDISIIPDLYYRVKKVTIIEDAVYNYVYREGSLSNGTYNKNEDYRLRRPMMEQRLEKYKSWKIKELVLLQYVHLYSLIAEHSGGKDKRLKEIQKEFRKQYAAGKYYKQIAASRKAKFLLASVSLKAYNRLVKIRA